MTQPTSINRAKTCASGRKSSVEALAGAPNSSLAAASTTLPHSARKLRWVSTQPLGRPVVPEV